MNDAPLMAHHSLHLPLPFTAVCRQLVELDGDFLREAALGAARQAEARFGTPGLRASEQAPGVTLQLGDPATGPGCFTIPMRWQAADHSCFSMVRGSLEAQPVSPAEAKVAVRLLMRPTAQTRREPARGRAQAALEAAAESFARRLFWVLEAHRRDEPCIPDGAPGAGAALGRTASTV